MRPHFTRTLLFLALVHQTWDLIVQGPLWLFPPLGHVQTCSTWTSLCMDPTRIPRHIHHEVHTVGKQAVLIPLECLSYYYDE